MHKLGYKIVDKNRAEIEPIVSAARLQSRPLEVGLYFSDDETLEYLGSELGDSGLPVNTHLNHLQVSLLSAVENECILRKQIEQSLALGASYSITHVNRLPTTARPAHRAALFESLEKGLQFVEQICSEYDYRIHLENVFQQLDFYQALFSMVQRLGLKRIHVCFDIGHAKVWSTAALPEWIDWLRALCGKGIEAHFHLHANNGLSDQHLSFIEAESAKLAGADEYTQGLDYFETIAHLCTTFPDSRKVFEVSAEDALRNMELVESRIFNSTGSKPL